MWIVRVSSWLLEIELTGEQIDDGLEVADRAIAACLGLGSADHAVGSLNQPVGDLAIEPAKVAVLVRLTGRAASMTDDRRLWVCPEAPSLKKRRSCFRAGLFIHLPEPDLEGPCRLEVTLRHALQHGALPRGQTGRVAQPDIAGAGRKSMHPALGVAHPMDRLVADPDGTELVECNHRLG